MIELIRQYLAQGQLQHEIEILFFLIILLRFKHLILSAKIWKNVCEIFSIIVFEAHSQKLRNYLKFFK